MNFVPGMFALRKFLLGSMPVEILHSLPGQVIHAFVRGFISYARGGHSAFLRLCVTLTLTLFSDSSAIFTLLGLDLIIFAASHVGSQLTSILRSLSVQMPSFLLLLGEAGRLDSAILQIDLHLGGDPGCGNNQVA
jgi:hypothetical protein